MAKFTKQGNWYVDSYYGDDANPGTAVAPFKTRGRAWTAASNGHRVICRGYFTEVLGTKNIIWEAEGLAVLSGVNLTGSETMHQNSFTLIGFRIEFFQGNTTMNTSQSSPYVLQDCEIHYTNITGRSFSYARCVFNDVNFNPFGSSNAGVLALENCTFATCNGSFVTTAGFNIRNNIFVNCGGLSASLPVDRPANSEFNYNNIVGTVFSRSHAQWQTYGSGGYQANGFAVPIADVLNDYSAGRDVITYWQQDFTMKPTCILRDAAHDGLEIGAKRVGYRFSADALWNNYRAASSNLTYSPARGLMLLDLAQGRGTYESTWIPVGANIQFDMANLFASFVMENANYTQFLGTRPAAPNNTVNQRRAFDFKLAIANNDQGAPDWKNQEFYRRVRLDGAGKGVSDDSYNPAVVQIPQGSYIKIMFEMNNTNIAV